MNNHTLVAAAWHAVPRKALRSGPILHRDSVALGTPPFFLYSVLLSALMDCPSCACEFSDCAKGLCLWLWFARIRSGLLQTFRGHQRQVWAVASHMYFSQVHQTHEITYTQASGFRLVGAGALRKQASTFTLCHLTTQACVSVLHNYIDSGHCSSEKSVFPHGKWLSSASADVVTCPVGFKPMYSTLSRCSSSPGSFNNTLIYTGQTVGLRVFVPSEHAQGPRTPACVMWQT